MSDEDLNTFFSFVINENLFSVDLRDDRDGEEFPLAPLVAYSMLLSKSHQIRSFCTKKWSLSDCFALNPLSDARTHANKLCIGLYIRLRNFFASYYNIAEPAVCIWDKLFQQMTGYNDSFMICTDAQPDTFHQDRWAVDLMLEGDICYSEVDFSIWGYPEATPPHSKVYDCMRQQDEERGQKSIRKFLIRQVKRHPDWVQEYRKKRSRPWYAGEHSDFLAACWRQCASRCPHSDELPEYPYPESTHPMYRLKSKWYPEFVLEETLQQAMVADSKEKWKEILQKLFPRETKQQAALSDAEGPQQ